MITVISGILLAAIVLSVLMWRGLRSRLLNKNDKLFIAELWADLKAQQNPMLKVVEADKILDAALTRMGYKGTLGEKLKTAGPRFTNLNSLWSAHKLRNTLVHEVNAQCNSKEIEQALNSFESALRDLGAL